MFTLNKLAKQMITTNLNFDKANNGILGCADSRGTVRVQTNHTIEDQVATPPRPKLNLKPRPPDVPVGVSPLFNV